MHVTLDDIAGHALVASVWTRLLRAIFAGWLIALLVWLLPFAETARVAAIIIITYIVGLAGFDHVVAGSTKAFYIVSAGHATLGAFFTQFWLPALAGNVIGGVLLAAVLEFSCRSHGGSHPRQVMRSA